MQTTRISQITSTTQELRIFTSEGLRIDFDMKKNKKLIILIKQQYPKLDLIISAGEVEFPSPRPVHTQAKSHDSSKGDSISFHLALSL
jgi:hypothetical protein